MANFERRGLSTSIAWVGSFSQEFVKLIAPTFTTLGHYRTTPRGRRRHSLPSYPDVLALMKRPNPTIRRLSTSSTRFPACHLTPEDEAQYMALSQRLLGRAIAECETTLIDMDSHWKYVRTIPVATSSLKVYKSTHHPSTAFGGAAAQVMATGIVSGTMDDIMTCLSADNSFAFRMNSALLMPKEHLDCEVLHTIVPLPTSSPTSSSTSDKFRFLGLKWGATKWPSASKHRDLCYLESTGVTRTSDTQGHVMEYGYCLMESIDLPAICPPLDQFSIKRVKVSLRHVFRTLPIGCTLVMSHCSIDLGSHASPSTMWMPPDLTTFPHLVSIAAAAEVATAIRLSNALLLRHPTTADNSTTWNVPEFLRKFPRECALCHHKSDRLQKHRVVNLLGSTGIKIVAQFFCHACATPPATPPATSPSSATSPPSPLGPVIRPRPAPTMPLAPFSEMQSRLPRLAQDPNVCPNASPVDVDVAFLDQLVRLSHLDDHLSQADHSSSGRSSDLLSVDGSQTQLVLSQSSGRNGRPTTSTTTTTSTSRTTMMHLPILDFDDDDEDDVVSVYSGLDISVRDMVVYKGTTTPTTLPSTSTTSTSTSYTHPVAQQLMQLNRQMQNTMDVLRRNQCRAEMLQRDLQLVS